MTIWDRPDVRPCDSCRWSDVDRCAVRPDPARRYRASLSHLPLPRDGGASCPQRLWSPREETIEAEGRRESSLARCAGEVSLLGREDLGQFTRDLAAAMVRLGIPDLDTAEARHRWRGDTRVDRYLGGPRGWS